MPITIELPPEAERRLTELAAQTGRDVDFYLREIVQSVLDDVEDHYLAATLHPKIPTLASLRAKHSQLRGNDKTNLKLRVHRALSWMERGQKETADPDAEFIFHWIGFESLCSEQSRLTPKKKVRDFLRTAVKADRDNSIYNRVIVGESETILTLAANAYVYTPFWNHYGKMSPQDPPEWADSLLGSVKRTIANMKRGEDRTFGALEVLFDCLRELRNQLSHGGSTWKSGVNRDQVEDGARIMSRLLPVFLDLMMDKPNSFTKAVGSPPPNLDSPQIIAEHNDYVCRLAKLASEADGDYREYLTKAVKRELVGKDDSFVACVREILYR